jgi:ubiquinone/menaquinone biosynthesis C-methylase UbiE
VRQLSFLDQTFDVSLDRGCFHNLPVIDRPQYELSRVVKPGGRLLLRASLRAAGLRYDISEDIIHETFTGWTIRRMARMEIPSDTRKLEVLEVRLARV